MNIIESTPNAIDLIAEEFVGRFRKGERPAVSEYEARFPEQAEAIRDLFPALVVLENLKPESTPVLTVGQVECASEVASLGKLGDYRIVREISRGGMGIVYEAVQESLGRQVALKVLPKQLMGDSSRPARFDREARAAARLHHTNIVPVFGVGAENGLHYYAMQYINGLGLDEVLRELKRLKSPSRDQSTAHRDREQPAEEPRRHEVSVIVTQALLSGQFNGASPQESDSNATEAAPPPARHASEGTSTPSRRPSEGADTVKSRLSDTTRLSDSFTLTGLQVTEPGSSRKTLWQSIARIGTQVGAALHYAHEEAVLHRDIKPSNLLLDTRGTVWVTDFGLAKADDQRDLTNTGDVLGTLRYMAPEMFSGQADRRSDVYSLGLTLYELLALRPAFDESDRGRLIRLVLHESPPRLRTLDPAIPRDLETIIHKSIDREPSHRYWSAQDLADDLQRFLDDEPIHARRVSPVTRFTRWCKRNPAIASLTSVIAFLLLVATGISLAAAMSFQQMASRNSKLAGDLKTALGDAEKNLAQVKEKEQLAQTNLSLATAEQQRAETNLDLALKAMDAVYLEAIGTEKLLGASFARPDDLGTATKPKAPLSDLEKDLLKRGLAFYDQFAQQNAATPRAAVHTAQAYYRVGLLQAVLDDKKAARAALEAAIARFKELTREDPNNASHWAQLGGSAFRLSSVLPDWPDARSALEKAADAYSKSLAIDPENGLHFYLRALVYRDLAQWGPAIRDIEHALKIDPNNRDALVSAIAFKSDADGKHRDRPGAIQHAAHLLTIDPTNTRAHIELSFLYRWLPNRPRQLEHAKRAVELDPKSGEARARLAQALLDFNDLGAALAAADKAIALAPDVFWLYVTRGQVRVAMNDMEGAMSDFSTAAQKDSTSYVSYRWRGKVYAAMGKHQAAIEDYNRAIQRRPTYTASYKERANSHFALNEFVAATKDLREARSLNPDDLSTLTWIPLAQVAACPDQAFKDGLIQLATDSVATNPAARHQRAALALHLGRLDLAREDLTEIVRAQGAQVRHYDLYLLAMLSLLDKNPKQYRTACRDLLAKFAESKIAEELNFTVWTAALVPQALDDYGPAIALAQRGLELNNESPEAIRSLGAILYRIGSFEEAAKQLTPLTAAAEKPSPEAKSSAAYPLFFLAMAQHQLGKQDEARSAIQKAVELTKAELSDDEKNPPSWNRKLTLELLQKEAEGLIGN